MGHVSPHKKRGRFTRTRAGTGRRSLPSADPMATPRARDSSSSSPAVPDTRATPPTSSVPFRPNIFPVRGEGRSSSDDDDDSAPAFFLVRAVSERRAANTAGAPKGPGGLQVAADHQLADRSIRHGGGGITNQTPQIRSPSGRCVARHASCFVSRSTFRGGPSQ
jgi:hypothetical protein